MIRNEEAKKQATEFLAGTQFQWNVVVFVGVDDIFGVDVVVVVVVVVVVTVVVVGVEVSVSYTELVV